MLTTASAIYRKRMDDSQYVRFHLYGWRGIIRQELLKRLPDADPAASLLSLPNTVIYSRDAVTLYRLSGDYEGLILRHDRMPKHRWYRSPRAVHHLRIQLRMIEAGLGVSTPWAGLYRTRGQRSEELFISSEIQGTNLARWIRENPDLQFRRRWLYETGKAVAELHRKGFVHGDLLMGNMMVEHATGRILFIDNERTRRMPWPLFEYHRRRNLEQMVCHFSRGYWVRVLQAFLDGYYTSVGLADRMRMERRWVLRKALARRRALNTEARMRKHIPVLSSTVPQ